MLYILIYIVIYFFLTASLLSKRHQDPIDAVVFAIGMQTILRQFHVSVMNRFIKYLCIYILSFITTER